MAACASASLAACAAADNRVCVLSPSGVTGRHCDDNHLVLDVTALAVDRAERYDAAIACGRSDGTVALLTSDGKLVRTLSVASITAPVCSLHFSAPPFLAIAWSQTPVVHLVDISTGYDVMELNADTHGVTCVTANGDGSLIATARLGIKVWSSAGKRVAKFSGCHEEYVVSMAFAGNALVSCSKDRLINVWPPIDNTNKSLSAKAPVMVLSCTSIPVGLRTGPALQAADEASVVATTKDGALHVWRLKSTVQVGHVPTLHACVSLPSDSNIVCAAFFDASRLLVVQGPLAAPTSALVSIVSSDGEVIAQPSLAPVPALAPASSGSSTSSRPSRAPPTRLDGTTVPTKRAKADHRPMDQRLNELVQRYAASAEGTLAVPATATSSSTPQSAASLARTLEQALQGNDNDGIEAVLQTVDEAVISTTVARLQASKVAVLLDALADRLQGKPGRAVGLLRWLRAILETHTALLQSDEGAKAALSKVYKVADARVGTLEGLLRLQGKLDLVFARQARGTLDKKDKPLLELDAEEVLNE